MAVIKGLIKGNDGYVRADEVRASNGRTNRPLSKLYPLEISTDEDCSGTESTNEATNEDSSGTELKKNTTKDERKTRNSATKAKHKLCQWSKEHIVH